MISDTFEYRRQARGPGSYLALGLAMGLIFTGWSQGWPFSAMILCGPFLALILVRLILNEAEGFRLTAHALEFYGSSEDRAIAWRDLNAVTLSGDGSGGAHCLLHLAGGSTDVLPATSSFSPERLGQEFRDRGVPVRRAQPGAAPFRQPYSQ